MLLTRADPGLGFLKLNTWIDLSANVADEAALEILCAAIRRQPPGPAGLHQIAAVRAEICPYRGLRPFREEDAVFFCGREAFTEKLIEAVARTTLVAVVGPSGSGKSSVVRAGLIPRLRQAKAGRVWEIATLVPTDRPLHSLAAALVPILEPEMTRVDRLAEINKLAGHLAEGAVALRDVAADVLRTQPGTDRLLLFVDQWEELYTLVADDGARRRFLVEVLDASAKGAVTVVFTLRGDFFGQALSDRSFADRLQEGQVNLGPMTEEELRRSIIDPADKVDLQFEPGLVDRILEDIGQEPGNLPLLEFVLAALWEQRQGATLLHDAYERMGGVQGAIAARANAEFEKLDAAQKDAARRFLIQMVRPGEGTEDTRQRALLPTGNEIALAMIRRLADARLVVTARDAATGEETVEVTHEALIRNWTLLRGWVDQDREFLRAKARIEAAEELWQKEKRDPSRLLAEGRPLAEGEEILARRREDLSPDLIAFIWASAAQARRGRRIRRLIAGGVMAALALLAGVATWFGYDATLKEREAIAQRERAKQQRQIALARQSAAQASLLADRGGSHATIERAAALAIESWRRLKNAEAVDVADRLVPMIPFAFIAHDQPVSRIAVSSDGRLLATTTWDTVRLIEIPNGKQVARIATSGGSFAVFSPDSRLLATWDTDESTARLFETTSGNEVSRITNSDGVHALAFSPDSRLLATASEDGTARLIEAPSGREVARVHDYGVLAVAFSPDSRWLATASQDGTARLIDSSTGREVNRIAHGRGLPFNAVVFSPDSRWLATASQDGTARLIETESGKEVARITHSAEVAGVFLHGPVNAITFSPDGRLLATGAFDRTARLIDITSGTEVARIVHEAEVRAVVFSPDGRLLATIIPANVINLVDGRRLATRGNTMRLIETATGTEVPVPLYRDQTLSGGVADTSSVSFSLDGRLLANMSGDTARLIDAADGTEVARIADVNDIAFSHDGRFLATASDDGIVRLIETSAATGRELARIVHSDRVQGFAFSPDSRWLATESPDRVVRLTEIPSGREVARIVHDYGVLAVAFSPDSRWLAMASGPMARLIETATGKEVPVPLVRVETLMSGEVPNVFFITFSPDGRWLATASSDRTVRLIDPASGKEVARVVHDDQIRHVAFSPDSRLLATASFDGAARLIEVATGKEFARVAHGGKLEVVVFSPDGRWLATASRDRMARLIETASGQEVRQIRIETASGKEPNITPWSITFSDDGRLLAITSGETVQLIEVVSGKELARVDARWSAFFSPDSRWLATVSQDRTARLIETASGQEVARIVHEGEVGAVAFSPDSRLLATASEDGTARLIETASGREVTRIGHGNGVHSVAFSPDGQLVATVSRDDTARLTETATGKEVARIPHIEGVAFSPNGRLLVTRNDDGTAGLMWADPQHLFDLLCTKAGRNLSVGEWKTYIGADEPWRPTCANWRNAEAPAQDR